MSKAKKLLALVLSLLMLLALLAACGADNAEPAKEDEKKEDTTPADDKKEDTTPADDKKDDAEPSDGDEPYIAAKGKDDSEIHAVCILPQAGGAAWGATKASFERGCAKYGWKADFMSPVTLNSTPECVTLAENAVSQGCDVLITPAVDGEVWADVLLRARAAGTVVISIVMPPEVKEGNDFTAEDLVNASVGFEAEEVARIQANAMNDLIPKDVQITAVYFHQLVNDQTSRPYNALCEEFEKIRPGTVVLGFEFDDNNPATAADKISALKLAHPELNCVVGMDMGTALGIHSFVSDAGLTDGDFWAIGVDASLENLGTIKAGTVDYILEQGYARFGEQAVDEARKIIRGEPYEWYTLGEMTLVGIDNVDKFAEEMGLGEVPEL